MSAELQSLIKACLSFDASKRPSTTAVYDRLLDLSARNAEVWSIPAALSRSREPGCNWTIDRLEDNFRWMELDDRQPAQRKMLLEVKAKCAGVNVSRVLLLDNPLLEARFAAQHQLMKTTLAGTGYEKIEHKDPAKRALDASLNRHLTELPGIRGVCWAFSGTSEKGAFKFARRGMVNRKRDSDKGYFGSGLYLTPQASSAALYCTDISPSPTPVAKNARGEHALLMAWCMVGNCYPITRDVDYEAKKEDSKFYGKAMDKSYDSHFVRVDPDKGYQAIDIDSARPPAVCYEELVLRDPAQVLPRFIVLFKA